MENFPGSRSNTIVASQCQRGSGSTRRTCSSGGASTWRHLLVFIIVLAIAIGVCSVWVLLLFANVLHRAAIMDTVEAPKVGFRGCKHQV
jgi:hypothetical protein